MLIALFCGGGDAGGENLAGFAGAGFACEELAVHEVGGDVIGMALEERSKMGIRGCRVAAVHALHGQAVARESVIGLFRDELFEHLAAGFLLVGHRGVPYYTGAASGVQLRAEREA
jgi:hypothetical protein